MPDQPMVIAIDGPAGSGKSTVTRRVAERLGILYLDTGAMYRAVTWGAQQSGIDLSQGEAVAAYVVQRQVSFDAQGQVTLDGVAPGLAIRTPEVTSHVYRVADHPACRAHLVRLQQAILAGRDAALEGRDTATVICPDAPLKIYLDASVEERARRRLKEWHEAGNPPSFATVEAQIRERDARDMGRAVGALRKTEESVVILTDGLPPQAVEASILAHAVKRRPLLLESRLTQQLLVGRSRQPGYVKVAQGSIMDPPKPWQLGLTNPSPDRLPGSTTHFACNRGGRQAGVLCQGRAVMCLAGTGDQPGEIVALPMLPQTWYVIEANAWHAVVQTPGTIAAWAESASIREERAALDATQQAVLQAWLRVYLPE